MITNKPTIKASLLAVLFAFATCIIPTALAQPPVPANPFAMANLDTCIGVSWIASSGATSYNVYRGTSSGGETLLATGVSSNTYEDAGLGQGQTYYYKITAVNGSGESAQSSEVSVLTLAPPPTNFTATVGDSKLVLSWVGTTSATNYRIYRDTLGGAGGAGGPGSPGGTTNFSTGNVTTYTDTGLINGQTYYYEICPINASGTNVISWSSASATPTGSGGEAPAGAPVNVTATSGSGQVLLTWAPVSNATSYNVYNGSGTLLQSGVTGVQFTNTGLTNGTVYYYKVAAVDGSQTGAQSVQVSATPHVPVAPSSLTATAGNTQVVLNWTPDGTSYAVYRGTAPGSETLLNSGLTGHTFTDAGLTNAVTYYYKVQCLNAGGASPLSTEVSAQPTGSAATPWSGTISFNAPGEPVQTVNAYIPDINRPINAAFIFYDNDPNILAVASKYNAISIAVGGYILPGFNPGPCSSSWPGVNMMDYRWPALSGARIQAALSQAALNFPAHPEFQYTGVVLYGFSVGTDATNPAIAQSALANRALAIINESEIDEDHWNPTLTTVPHVFLSSGLGDGYSSLNVNLEDWPVMTHDTYVRGLATNQGAPLTTIDNVGVGHGGNGDNPFISIWLNDVLSQRLPATVPVSSPVSLPSWQNSFSWVGTYTVTTNSAAPWDGGVQLINDLVSTRTSYTDPRPFTWLPSQNTANAWLLYAELGNVVSTPDITSPLTAAGTVDVAFSYQITATNSPTSYNAVNLPSGLTVNTGTGLISGTASTSGTGTVTISAGNASGTATASLTLTIFNATSASIGIQFQGGGTALSGTQLAGLAIVAKTNWNVLTGFTFSNNALSDSTGAATAAKLSGGVNGAYGGGVNTAPPAGNATLTSGEIFTYYPPGSYNLTVSNIPYAAYSVYVYASVDAQGRAETISVAPSGGTTQYYSFTTRSATSNWVAATSTWSGTGTQPSLPPANYACFTGLGGTSFTMTFGAPGNGSINGIQIVPVSYSISTGTSPANGGTADGAGIYNSGSTATMTATPNSGFAFVNWTESGTTASTLPNYTFTVTANRSLTANFLPTTFATWESIWFTTAELSDPSVSGDLANPSEDGICNLLDYAFNLKPTVHNNASFLPQATMPGGYVALTYSVNKSAGDLVYTVEVSGNLQTWNSGPSYTSAPVVLSDNGTTQTVQVTDLTAISAAGSRFIRLRVTNP